MKRTLVVLAIAGAMASGAAAAATTIRGEYDSATLTQVQYYDNDRDRWNDRSMSIDQREARINARIERGMNDGRLTRREARRLYRELHTIEAKERSFKSDGRLDRRETTQLNEDLDRLAFDVGSQLRDEQRRY